MILLFLAGIVGLSIRDSCARDDLSIIVWTTPIGTDGLSLATSLSAVEQADKLPPALKIWAGSLLPAISKSKAINACQIRKYLNVGITALPMQQLSDCIGLSCHHFN
jgi:hypothetical protein